MAPSDPTPRPAARELTLALGVIFFSSALLCFLLGLADGVRHDRTYLHIPQTGSWLVASGILAAIAVIFLIWSRVARRS